jgi:hypothetical protein
VSAEINLKIEQKENHADKCLHLLMVSAGQSAASKIILRSKDEIALFKLCLDYFINVGHNTVITDGWDADIILNNQKIAVLWNGPWHYKEMPGLKHSLLQVQTRDMIKIKLFEDLGWKVVIFEDRHFTPDSACISKKNGNGAWNRTKFGFLR